eukprot:c17700_g1_i1 orf=288-542(+)
MDPSFSTFGRSAFCLQAQAISMSKAWIQAFLQLGGLLFQPQARNNCKKTKARSKVSVSEKQAFGRSSCGRKSKSCAKNEQEASN